jgi:hypothetical protein
MLAFISLSSISAPLSFIISLLPYSSAFWEWFIFVQLVTYFVSFSISAILLLLLINSKVILKYYYIFRYVEIPHYAFCAIGLPFIINLFLLRLSSLIFCFLLSMFFFFLLPNWGTEYSAHARQALCHLSYYIHGPFVLYFSFETGSY